MVAPASASAVAIVLPSPRAPPVISATLPSSRNRSNTVFCVIFSHCSRGPPPLALARGRRSAALPSGPSLGPQALFTCPLSLPFLKPGGPHPKRFRPPFARSNVLQILVKTLMREVQRVRNPRHRFEADEIAAWRRSAGRSGQSFRRENNGSSITGPNVDVDPMLAAPHAHRRV